MTTPLEPMHKAYAALTPHHGGFAHRWTDEQREMSALDLCKPIDACPARKVKRRPN